MDIPKATLAAEVTALLIRSGRLQAGSEPDIVAAEQHRRDLAWFVSLLRERVKAQEHDGCEDCWIDGLALADDIERGLKEGT